MQEPGIITAQQRDEEKNSHKDKCRAVRNLTISRVATSIKMLPKNIHMVRDIYNTENVLSVSPTYSKSSVYKQLINNSFIIKQKGQKYVF